MILKPCKVCTHPKGKHIRDHRKRKQCAFCKCPQYRPDSKRFKHRAIGCDPAILYSSNPEGEQ